jgi:hypothetical protein
MKEIEAGHCNPTAGRIKGTIFPNKKTGFIPAVTLQRDPRLIKPATKTGALGVARMLFFRGYHIWKDEENISHK